MGAETQGPPKYTLACLLPTINSLEWSVVMSLVKRPHLKIASMAPLHTGYKNITKPTARPAITPLDLCLAGQFHQSYSRLGWFPQM